MRGVGGNPDEATSAAIEQVASRGGRVASSHAALAARSDALNDLGEPPLHGRGRALRVLEEHLAEEHVERP